MKLSHDPLGGIAKRRLVCDLASINPPSSRRTPRLALASSSVLNIQAEQAFSSDVAVIEPGV